MKQSSFIRYLLPPICILFFAGVLFLCLVNSQNTESDVALTGVAILAAINIFLYFFFQLCTQSLFRNEFISAFACLAGAFFLSGQAFRVMHWPGAAFQLYTAGILLMCALVMFFLKKRSGK